ncbi:Protein of unknown function [Pyronema omphalodes CBS 100304]|uniref:Uncharacterized protein n=1 Tax=Pyronema omphalodes (strain CBS 100304) TaxID=1076935 RepID=U4LD43_PYROM|nr:Protein of unknown function [Pyronema omphalodes CBS 100304]
MVYAHKISPIVWYGWSDVASFSENPPFFVETCDYRTKMGLD